MESPYPLIIQNFVDTYGLTRSQVIAEIEKTFSSMLSRWHQCNVIVVFTGKTLSAVGYKDTPHGPEQVQIDITAMRGWNTIKRILDKNLGKAACLEEVSRYKRREHGVFWGNVISRDENNLGVELNLEFGVTLLATCPLRYIGKHERDYLRPGDQKAFHLRKVEAIQVGDTARTHLTVDRVSKNLVEKLLVSDLRAYLNDVKVVCKNRYVGHKSFVESNTFLPKRVILQTSQELEEHIQVKVVKKKKLKNNAEKSKEQCRS